MAARLTYRQILPLILLVSAVALILESRGHLTSTTALRADKEPLLLPPTQLDKFTFGHADLVADLLWLRSIQAFDFCGGTFVSDEQATYGKRTVHLCDRGWVFQMLDAATRAAPRYRIIYTRGAVNLSVVVNDRLGARALYLRGMESFPNHWGIFFQAGYHEALEMGDNGLAAKYFDVAWRKGAPLWLPLLAAQLYNKAGKAELGLRALADFYRDKDFPDWPIRVRERWAELEQALGRKVSPREFVPSAN